MVNSPLFMNLSLRIKAALVVVILLWASAFVGIRAGLESYSPGGLALLRFIIASFTIYLIYVRQKKRTPMEWQDRLLALFTGAIGIGIYNIALNYGELVVSSGMASFIVSQSPVVTTVLAVLFLRERVTIYSVAGMIISGLGVGLIVSGSDNQMNYYLGILYVLVATLVGSLYSILQKSLSKKYSAIDLTTYAIWGGTLMLLVFIPDMLQDLQQASVSSTMTVIYLGIFPAALAYLGWSYILSQIPASQAVSFLYFAPIAATLIGWLWLGEVPPLLAFVGGLISLLGVWMVNQTFSKKSQVTVEVVQK